MQALLYGQTKSCENVKSFVLRNNNGMEVHCIEYGCRITKVLLPQENSPKINVVLGFNSLEEYENDPLYHGAIIGRYANRIEGAQLKICGRDFKLLKNDGGNFLHGTWASKVFSGEYTGENSVSFTYLSPHGEDGFPGEVWVSVTYTLTDVNGLMIDCRAVPQAPTYINITQHAYFNLAGQGNILNHSLQLNSNSFLEIKEGTLSTGQVLAAENAFDFSIHKLVGQDIKNTHPQMLLANGYDFCYILNNRPGKLAFAAELKDPPSGRSLKMYTNQPAVQFFSGNCLSGYFQQYAGLCLEAQCYPNSPHMPQFPNTFYKPKEKYRNTIIYDFAW